VDISIDKGRGIQIPVLSPPIMQKSKIFFFLADGLILPTGFCFIYFSWLKQ